MNKKQIEARIKMEANQIEIPDLKQQILAQVPNRKVIVKKEKRTFGSFAIRFSYIMSVFIIVLLGIVMINNVNNQSQDNPTEVLPTDTPTTVKKDVSQVQQAYAKGAATLVGLVGSVDSVTQPLASSINLLTTSTDSTDYSAIAEEINKYFAAVSRLLDEDNASYTIEVLSDSEYMYKLTITNKVLNDIIETIVYYSESSLGNSDMEDLDEISTAIVGIIIQDGKAYHFSGTKELEDHECNIELTLKISDDNYVTVSQEIEGAEKEFEYKFHRGNKAEAWRIINIEIESDEDDEDSKKDISVEIEEKGRRFWIDFKYGKDEDKDHVDVKYHHNRDNDEDDDESDDFEIREDEENKDQYRFSFKDKDGNDRSENVDKHHGRRGEDDHDDDDHRHDEDDD